MIRSKTVGAKDAVLSLKTRMESKNLGVVLLALGLIDICIKNSGDGFLVEIAGNEFLEAYVGLIQVVSSQWIDHQGAWLTRDWIYRADRTMRLSRSCWGCFRLGQARLSINQSYGLSESRIVDYVAKVSPVL